MATHVIVSYRLIGIYCLGLIELMCPFVVKLEFLLC